VRIEVRFLGHVAQPALERGQVVDHAASVEKNLAVTRFEQSHDHLHRGAFARPVRPDVAEDFPRPDGKADIVDRRNPLESLGEIADFEHGFWTPVLEGSSLLTSNIKVISSR
jgi:hypothetical protein